MLSNEPRRHKLFYDFKKAVSITEELVKEYGLQVNPNDTVAEISVGLQQRVEILKTLHRGADVLILDEPTAALDALAESKLYGDFDKLIGNKTAVYISHRLSSTQFCDKVAMFKDGGIVEYGTHSELMDKGGEYADMFNVQAQYYIDNNESEVAVNA